jgi:hypothetical protein
MVSYTAQVERRRKLNRRKAGKRNKKLRSRRTVKFAVHPEKA